MNHKPFGFDLFNESGFGVIDVMVSDVIGTRLEEEHTFIDFLLSQMDRFPACTAKLLVQCLALAPKSLLLELTNTPFIKTHQFAMVVAVDGLQMKSRVCGCTASRTGL